MAKTKANDYYALLRHPEWQKKRLKIMERAKFRCQECFADDETLNVHHRYYTKGAKPWEYPDGALVCLCESCHESRHKSLDEAKQLLGYLPQCSLERVLGYIKAAVLRNEPKSGAPDELPRNAQGELCFSIGDDDLTQPCGMGDYIRLYHYTHTSKLIQRAGEEGGVTPTSLHEVWESGHGHVPANRELAVEEATS